MKLKSLILGSVAAAGLSTAGYAADLGVLTSLDVCDTLGLSGLTLSSETNCLQITGGVSYEFVWGDYVAGTDVVGGGVFENGIAITYDGTRNIPADDGLNDWESQVEAWLKVVGTAPSDFGPATAVIKLKEVDETRVAGEVSRDFPLGDDDTGGVVIDEAYVSVGDTTVIMAGRKGSIANLSDDEPFNFLGLFNSDAIDGKGVAVDGDTTYLGGHVIQVVSDLGNGVNVGLGLENLNGNSGDVVAVSAEDPERHGTLVGVVSYAGAGVTAHVTGAAIGILDGEVESWFVHAGATGTFDAFKVRGAVGYFEDRNYGDLDVLHALVSVEGTFDLFKIALSGEVANVTDVPVEYTDYGFGGSVGVAVTEGVAINLGARYFHDDDLDRDTTQVALQAVAAVTETIKLTGEVGAYFGDGVEAAAYTDENVYYGAAELAWAPGGGFTSSVKGEAFNTGAYKVTFKAAKSFE